MVIFVGVFNKLTLCLYVFHFLTVIYVGLYAVFKVVSNAFPQYTATSWYQLNSPLFSLQGFWHSNQAGFTVTYPHQWLGLVVLECH